jgi:hypothetical protein
MDESADNGASERQSHAADAAKAGRTPTSETSAAPAVPSKAQATESANAAGLPIVWSPKLDASVSTDGIHVDGIASTSADTASSTAAGQAAKDQGISAAATSRSRPFSVSPALLAASIACAVAAGAVGAPHLARLMSAVRSDTSELAALKANLDGVTRSANAQIARLAERLDHVEHAQSEPAAKIAHLAEAIDRLEKKNAAASAAAETTGSIPAGPPAPPAEAKPPERVLHDWVMRSVRGGRALVQSRYGGVFVVTTGSFLPGLGRVEVVQRQDGQWVVATGRGVIAGR